MYGYDSCFREGRGAQAGLGTSVCMFTEANEKRVFLLRGVCEVYGAVRKTGKALYMVKCVMAIFDSRKTCRVVDMGEVE
jgi:hypothetical protein